jgi:formamidopyrimidine-DNA glycosylase
VPELPDVESIRRHLESTVLKRRIADVHVTSPAILQGTSPARFREALRGRAFASTSRHGKHLFVGLDRGGKELAIHFGMTGSLRFFEDMGEDPAHDRLRIDFEDSTHLAYDSVRKLGRVQLIDDHDSFISGKQLGPDALTQVDDFESFRELLGGKRGNVKAVFMDQKLIAGIGNVYSDEILFQARVNPKSRIDALDEEVLRALFKAMREVLQTSIDTGADPEKLPRDYLIHQRHAKGVCPLCGGRVKKETIAGRTAYYCPSCQQR